MAKTLIAIIVCLSFAAPVFAASSDSPKAAAQTKPARPDWWELTREQQSVLAPLRDDWRELDTTRRKKWIKVADSFPKMKPEEQKRLQARMKEWAKLTPQQRRVAREKFITIKKLPAAKRDRVTAQWWEYQQSLAAKPAESGQEAANSDNPN